MTASSRATLALQYLSSLTGSDPDPGALAYWASLDQIGAVDPVVVRAIARNWPTSGRT